MLMLMRISVMGAGASQEKLFDPANATCWARIAAAGGRPDPDRQTGLAGDPRRRGVGRRPADGALGRLEPAAHPRAANVREIHACSATTSTERKQVVGTAAYSYVGMLLASRTHAGPRLAPTLPRAPPPPALHESTSPRRAAHVSLLRLAGQAGRRNLAAGGEVSPCTPGYAIRGFPYRRNRGA
jgi:hypothetical protein